MRAAYPTNVKVGVALCAALALWGAVAFAGRESDDQARDPYMISAQSMRLDTLRAAVPEDATLGYVTDAAPGSVMDLTLFNAARYALAPRMLVPGTSHDRVLGNFTRPTDYGAFGAQRGLQVETDFGNGVVLFRKGSR